VHRPLYVIAVYCLSLAFSSFSYAQGEGQGCGPSLVTENIKARPPSMPAEKSVASAIDLLKQAEALGVYGGKRRREKKEFADLNHQLSHIQEHGEGQYRQKLKSAKVLTHWSEFNQFWQSQMTTFSELPKESQQELWEPLQLVMSIGIKHFIAYAESPSDHRLNGPRLETILTSHVGHQHRSLEENLYILTKNVQKYYSNH